jgi:hypothetical protein
MQSPAHSGEVKDAVHSIHSVPAGFSFPQITLQILNIRRQGVRARSGSYAAQIRFALQKRRDQICPDEPVSARHQDFPA